MKNIHLLPTEKPSRLFNCFGELGIGNCVTTRKDLQVTNQYIYITSDVDIEEGDWCIDDEGIVKCTAHSGAMSHYYSKIILTTDEDLIKDGVQAIDDEFLEWFVKNSSCEKAEIKMENYYASGALQPNLWQYKIIIPKEEPKQIKCYCGHTTTCDCEPLEEYENISTIEKMKPLQKQWQKNMDKTLKECKQNKEKIEQDFIECVSKSQAIYQPKQETLEETYQVFLQNKYNNPHLTDNKLHLPSFEFGAKWQAERMFDEEEVKKIALDFSEYLENNSPKEKGFDGKNIIYQSKLDLFEQFKNK